MVPRTQVSLRMVNAMLNTSTCLSGLVYFSFKNGIILSNAISTWIVPCLKACPFWKPRGRAMPVQLSVHPLSTLNENLPAHPSSSFCINRSREVDPQGRGLNLKRLLPFHSSGMLSSIGSYSPTRRASNQVKTWPTLNTAQGPSRRDHSRPPNATSCLLEGVSVYSKTSYSPNSPSHKYDESGSSIPIHQTSTPSTLDNLLRTSQSSRLRRSKSLHFDTSLCTEPVKAPYLICF